MTAEHAGGMPPASYFSDESSGQKSFKQPVPGTSSLSLANALTSPPVVLPFLEASWRANGDAHEIPIRNNMRCVLAAHPADIHTILTGKGFSEKGPLYNGVRRILGEGILTTSGEAWRASRRHIVPSFGPKQVDQMVETMGEVGTDFVRQLGSRAAQGPLDIQQEMTTLTLDTLIATLFGPNVDAKDLPSHDTFTTAFQLVGNLGSMPGNREEMRKRRAAISQSLHASTQTLIEKTRTEEPDGSLLSMLIHAKDGRTGQPLDDQTIRSELLTMMFAGHDTSALTLTWFFQTLKDYPDVTARVQNEIDSVLEGRRPTLGDLSRLVYTRQVIDEVLRLKPTVPLLARVANEEAKIQDMTIEPGDVVLPFIWAAHRHPDFWSDAEAFDPDRFSAERSASRDRRAYVPFASGNRICIGKRMALTEIATHVALLMQNFDIEVHPNNSQPDAHVTLRPSEPMYASMHPRS